MSVSKYPVSTIIAANTVSFGIYAIGAYILTGFGALWAGLYLYGCMWIELKLLYSSCVNCCYYGKRCAFGRGWVSSLLFYRGDPAGFAQREISLINIIPEMLLFLVPLVCGIILLIIDFSWIQLIPVILLVLLATVGNGIVRGKMACPDCAQRELGCPAEQFFNKNKRENAENTE